MALPGTVLANKALDNCNIKLSDYSYGRLFTQKLAKGRSHKIYFCFVDEETAERLVAEITRLGGHNARAVVGHAAFRKGAWCSGVRFEVEEEA